MLVLELLLRLADELAMALVLVTHDLGVIAETCDRVGVMYAGRLCESGPVAEVLARPSHAYTEALLRSVPGATPPRTRLVPIPGQPPSLAGRQLACAFAPRCARAEPACVRERPAMVRHTPDHASACFAAARLRAEHAA